VIGTRGHVGDILIPKTIVNGLNQNRTQLFSEEENKYFYSINFDGEGENGSRNVKSETDFTIDATTKSTVSVVNDEKKLIYTIVLPIDVANNINGIGETTKGIATFTEAGFYCGSSLFNIKTFPVKVKQEGIKITIIWTLEF
jgi:hypothetical protein